jgi:hypothetical protein
MISSLNAWLTQRVCSISLIALLCLVYFALWHSRYSQEIQTSFKRPTNRPRLTDSQHVFVFYTTFVHFLAFLFPFRLCWGVWSLTRSLKKVTNRPDIHPLRRPSYDSELDGAKNCYVEAVPLDSSNEVLHAIIVPNYKEDLDTLRETLDVLACHPQASSNYEVGYIVSFRLSRLIYLHRFTSPWNKVKKDQMVKQRSS